MVAIWPSKIGLFETVCQKKYYLAIFLASFGLLKKVHFKACFGEICGKDALFYKIIILNLVILTNF